MLGMLLTESVEGIWALMRITWNGGTGIYNWYYDDSAEEKEREKNEIIELKKRIDELEKCVENGKKLEDKN